MVIMIAAIFLRIRVRQLPLVAAATVVALPSPELLLALAPGVEVFVLVYEFLERHQVFNLIAVVDCRLQLHLEVAVRVSSHLASI